MLLARINRTEPERILVIVKAAEALLEGRPVCYQFDGTNDGKDAYLADAAIDATRVIGLADEAIASGAYGRVLVYGLKTNAIVYASKNMADNCGGILNVASGNSGRLELSVSLGAATVVQPNFVVAHSASLASGSDSDVENDTGVFVRCL